MKKFLGIILSVLLIFSMNLSYAFAEAGATDSNGHNNNPVGNDDNQWYSWTDGTELNAPPKMVYRSTIFGEIIETALGR